MFYLLDVGVVVLPSMFLAFQLVSGLLWQLWICAGCFFDSNNLNSCCCWHSSIPPFLELSPSGDWGDILYYAISGRLRSLGLQLLFSFRTRLWLPLPFQQLCAPVLYWSGNLIKHVSLKMQYPAHQHMGLEHFVLAGPAVSLIRFAACFLIFHLHDSLTLPATGLCKNTSFFPTPNQPHLPPTILLALQRTHIPAVHLHYAFTAKLKTPRCTTATTKGKKNKTWGHHTDSTSILYTAHQTKQPKQELLSVCLHYISHLFTYFTSNTPTQICVQK